MSDRHNQQRPSPPRPWVWPEYYESREEQQEAQRISDAAGARARALLRAEMDAAAAERAAAAAPRRRLPAGVRQNSEDPSEDDEDDDDGEVFIEREDPEDDDYVPPGQTRQASGPKRTLSTRIPPASTRTPTPTDQEPDETSPPAPSGGTRPKGKGRAVAVIEDEEMDVGEEEGSDAGVEAAAGDVGEDIAADDSEDEEEEVSDEEQEEEEEEEDGQEEEEDDDEDDNANAPADTLPISSKGWVFQQPKSLSYFVFKDAAQNLKAKKIQHPVDFNVRDDVKKANKTRRLEIRRSYERNDIPVPVKRASMRGREFTEASNVIISAIHYDYAKRNGGKRIPRAELADVYNQCFPGENRSESSLSTHMERTPDLKAQRNSLLPR